MTATEAHYAREGLAVLAKASAKGTSEIASSPGGPNAPKDVQNGAPVPTAQFGGTEGKRNQQAHKRLSLSDLKRAAAARKAK